jgi:chromosome segregation ATPase
MREEVDQFGVLEEKISQLIEAYSSLKNEKTSQGEKFAQKEAEIQGLKEKMARLTQEREVARGKVEKLLERIDRLIAPAGKV